MNYQQNKRMIFIIVGIVDAILSGVVLLLYFGLLPIDISEWGMGGRHHRWCLVSFRSWLPGISIDENR